MEIAMLSRKYSKEEVALEVADKLAPGFDELRQQLSDIADAVGVGGSSEDLGRHEEPKEDSAQEKSDLGLRVLVS